MAYIKTIKTKPHEIMMNSKFYMYNLPDAL